MDVCQKCGDKGDKKRLIYCVKCRAAAEHSYCFDILPKKGEKNIIWTCEECKPREATPIPKPSIRSVRISRAVENKLNRMEILKQKGVSTASKVSTSMQKKGDSQPIGNPSCLKQESSENAENGESLKRRRQIAIDESSSDEESEPIRPIAGDEARVFVYVDKPVLAHPVVDPIWRGYLKVESSTSCPVIGIVGHLSTKSCAKVKNAIKEMSVTLNASLFPRSDLWPWKLDPTDECISVYLFPEHERDEKHFDVLMNEMIIHDQALQVATKALQLFVFHSRNLSPEHWRKPIWFVQEVLPMGCFGINMTKPHRTCKDGPNGLKFTFRIRVL